MDAVRSSDLRLLRRWVVARLLPDPSHAPGRVLHADLPADPARPAELDGSGSTSTCPEGKVDFAQYFTPSIGVYALAVSCYVAPIFGLATARELGTLKRVRGTPLSPWIYVTAWLAATILTGLTATTLMFVVSVPAFGVHIYPHLLPAAIVTAVLGAIALWRSGSRSPPSCAAPTPHPRSRT